MLVSYSSTITMMHGPICIRFMRIIFIRICCAAVRRMSLHYSSVRFNHHHFAADLHEEHPVQCSWITTAFVPDPRALAV